MTERSAPGAHPEPSLWRRSLKRRPRTEVLCEWLFRPLAHAVVRPLAALRVPPPAVVLVHTAIGLLAAVLIARGRLVEPAILLQVKTLLDNADGQLARATNRVSEVGRYLDTECDWLVNGALFAALALVSGEPLLAAAAAVALMLTLSVDFNLEYLYRRERGEQFRAPAAAAGGRLERLVRRVYHVTLGWQDTLVRHLADRHLEHLQRGIAEPRARAAVALAYHDGLSLSVLVNLGLSTQLVVLGACLVLGAPEAYLWFALAGAVVPLAVVVRRHLLALQAAAPQAVAA